MKFKVIRSKFLDGLKSVQNIVAGKGSLPILQNVLIVAENDTIKMTTTDLDISIKSEVSCEVKESGGTTLPVKLLFTSITKAAEGEIEVEVDSKERATIKAGSARFKLQGMPQAEFPQLPEDGDAYMYNIPQVTLREMLRKTAYASSQDDTRRTLKGVLMSFKDSKLTMVATDGRRLAMVENELEFPKAAEKDIVLPSKAVAELQRSLAGEGEVAIMVQKSQICFKLENMQLQHNERDELVNDQKEKVPLAVISAVDGDGLKDLFASLGCAYVIDGGATMNTSAEEFLSAMDSVSADRIVVLPNNKNSIGAANQARSLYKGGADVTVLESKSMVEAYYALAMDVADSTDLDYRVSQMQSGIDGNHTLAAAVASKDYSLGEVSIKAGDSIAMLDGEIVAGNTDMLSAVMAGMKEMPDVDEKSVCIVFRGDGVPEEAESELESAINDAYPDLEVSFIDGGQHIYNWLTGLI